MDWEFQATLQLGLLSLSRQLWVLVPAVMTGALARSWRMTMLLWLPMTTAVALYANLRFGARWIGGGNEGFAAALAIITLVCSLLGHLLRRATLVVRHRLAA